MMTVNIWSDVRCPFCYIGKHKFEKALEQFPHKDEIKVIWHSFELDPYLKTQPDVNALDHLAESKGISRAQAEQMTEHAAQAAKEAGLSLDFNRSVVANSLDAHKLIQLAKTKGSGTETEETLFKAYFTEGKNIADRQTLLQLGVSLGLEEKEIEEALSSDAYAQKVREDEKQARSLGIRGVPFFVFNDKYAVSGAQSPAVFLQALEQSWSAYDKDNKIQIVAEAASCSTDGNCGEA